MTVLLVGLTTLCQAAGTKLKVTFTDQWGELGLCSKLPISLDNYKGFRVEFAEAAPANLQLKVQNATDQADTNNYPGQYVEVESGATQKAVDFDTNHFGTDRTVTVLSIQAKVANVTMMLKRTVLIKSDGTEEECSYDANSGWNRTLEEISDDTPGGGGGDDPTPGGDTGTSDKIEAETMTPGGQYAGVCSSPFNGMGVYANGDCATKTVTFPVKTGLDRVGVRGASSNNSGAGIALYVLCQRRGIDDVHTILFRDNILSGAEAHKQKGHYKGTANPAGPTDPSSHN